MERADSVTLTSEIELTAGTTLSDKPDLSVGIGNVIGNGNVDFKGRAMISSGSGSGYSKKVQVKWPPVDRKTLQTKAGKARITITMARARLHDAGFDTEGIVNTITPGKTKLPRSIQMAIMLDGVSYYSQAKATYTFNKGTGQLMMQK